MIGSVLGHLAAKYGYALTMEYDAFLRQPSAKLEFDPSWILSHLARNKKKVCFIQIGANDGESNDPIRDYILNNQWTGLLVEPDPDLFNKLRQNYADQGELKFLNAAIGSGQPMDFYSVDALAPGAPAWASNLGSFNKDVILSHGESWPTMDGHLRKRRIDTITPDQMFSELGTQNVDLLIMDVEGYEWEILQRIDLRRNDIGCIYYENKHLPRQTHEKVVKYLADNGYAVGVGAVGSVGVKKCAVSVGDTRNGCC